MFGSITNDFYVLAVGGSTPVVINFNDYIIVYF